MDRYITEDRVHAERRGTQFGCPPGRFLDATFVRTDDSLTFTDGTAQAVDSVLFASRPLTRVEG